MSVFHCFPQLEGYTQGCGTRTLRPPGAVKLPKFLSMELEALKMSYRGQEEVVLRRRRYSNAFTRTYKA